MHVTVTNLMSDYDFRPGGSLKLKGVAEGGIIKKYVWFKWLNLSDPIPGRKKRPRQSRTLNLNVNESRTFFAMKQQFPRAVCLAAEVILRPQVQALTAKRMPKDVSRKCKDAEYD